MPHACSAAFASGELNAAPKPPPRWPPPGAPVGRGWPLGRGVGVGTAIPAACRHASIFCCSAGSMPRPAPCPPGVAAAVLAAGVELVDPPQPASPQAATAAMAMAALPRASELVVLMLVVSWSVEFGVIRLSCGWSRTWP
jgi:hypothetical protein